MRGTIRRRRCCCDLATRLAIASTPATTASAAATTRAVVGNLATTFEHWTGRRFDRYRRGDRGNDLSVAGDVDLHLAVLELRHANESALRRFLREARELRHAEILLVKRRVALLHHLLEAIGAHDVAVALHAGRRFDDELPWITLDVFLFVRLHEAGERVVAVVLVAVLHEQIARRFADAD